MAGRRSTLNVQNSQTSHSTRGSQQGSRVFGVSLSKRNVAFDSRLEKTAPKKTVVQGEYYFILKCYLIRTTDCHI